LLPFTREPNCFVLIPQTGKASLLFYQPRDYWHVVPQDPDTEIVSAFDFISVASIADIKEALARIVGTEKAAFLGKKPRKFRLPDNYDLNPETLTAEFSWLRATKSAYEQACLFQASLNGARSHLAAKTAFYAGKSEMEIHQDYVHASGGQESDLPYSNIIALNEHAAVLHYTELKTTRLSAENLRSFLIDAGGSFNGYASDITRTYAFSNGEFADMIAFMEQKQLDIISAIEPGNSYVDLHRMTHYKIAETLLEFNLLETNVDTAIETGITTPFFPHGLGHHLGLNVHDAGGHQAGPDGGRKEPPAEHPYLRNTRTIEIDQYFTIEPGLYFIPQLLADLKDSQHAGLINWPRIETFLPYGGIRIEDDVLVTKDGVDNYTRRAFAQLV